MLEVDWRRLPDLPPQGPAHSGFQDSDGGWLLNRSVVVTAFGYGGGGFPGFFNTCWVRSNCIVVLCTYRQAQPSQTFSNDIVVLYTYRQAQPSQTFRGNYCLYG